MQLSPRSKRLKLETGGDSSVLPIPPIQDAVHTLCSPQTESAGHQRAAAQVYVLAGESAAAATEALDAGAAEALCAVLRNGPEDAKRNAAAALYNLAPTAELAARAAETGALDALVDVLTDGHEDASQNASAALYRFAHTVDLASSILDAGAAPALVRILHRGADGLRQHAAAALYALARDGPLAQRVIGAGAPCALFEVMQTSSTPAACEAACEALCALVRTPEHAAHVVDTGVVPGLIRMLASACTRSQRLAACTISALAAADEGGAIVAAGAVPIVVGVLLSGEPRAQEYAACALSNLASSFGPRSNFVEAGALPALIAAMRSGTPVTRRSAVAALHHLTLDTPIGVFAVGAGALPPLIAALSCGDRATEEAAAGVSYNLACESLALGGQLLDAGMLEPLVQMLSVDRHSDAALDLAAGAILSLAGEPTLRARVLAHSATLLIVRIGARRPRGRALTLMDTLMSDSHARRQMLSAFGREFEDASAELRTLRERNRQLEDAHRTLAAAIAVDDEPSAAHVMNDVTFRFKDGRTLGASKLLLATGSEYFRAQLCGPECAAPLEPPKPAAATSLTVRAPAAAEDAQHDTEDTQTDEDDEDDVAAHTVAPPQLPLAEAAAAAAPEAALHKTKLTEKNRLHRRRMTIRTGDSPPLQQRCLREAGVGVVHPDESFSFEAYHELLRQLHSSGFEPLPDSAALVVELHALSRKMAPMPTATAVVRLESATGSAVSDEPPKPLPDTLARVATQCELRMIEGLDIDNCLDLLLHARACDGAHRLLRAASDFVRLHLRSVTTLLRWQSFCAQHPALALELMTGAAVALDEELRTANSSPYRRKRRNPPPRSR